MSSSPINNKLGEITISCIVKSLLKAQIKFFYNNLIHEIIFLISYYIDFNLGFYLYYKWKFPPFL